MSNVQSKPLVNGEVEETKRRRPLLRLERPAAGILALLFGVPLWVWGGWYTLNGWVIALNLLGAQLRQTGQIAAPYGEGALIGVVLMALAYSLVEVKLRPGRPQPGAYGFWAMALLLWILVMLTDIGSTFLGVVATPSPNAWTITKQVAANPFLAGSWSLILTFLPEGLILVGVRFLFGR